MICPTGSPPLKTSSVGMLRIWYWAAVFTLFVRVSTSRTSPCRRTRPTVRRTDRRDHAAGTAPRRPEVPRVPGCPALITSAIEAGVCNFKRLCHVRILLPRFRNRPQPIDVHSAGRDNIPPRGMSRPGSISHPPHSREAVMEPRPLAEDIAHPLAPHRGPDPGHSEDDGRAARVRGRPHPDDGPSASALDQVGARIMEYHLDRCLLRGVRLRRAAHGVAAQRAQALERALASPPPPWPSRTTHSRKRMAGASAMPAISIMPRHQTSEFDPTT